MNILRVLASLVAVVLIAMVIRASQKGPTPEPTADGTATAVTVLAAAPGSLTVALELAGIARATRAMVLFIEVDGRVAKVHFQEGQTVQAGDVLLTLMDQQAKEDLAQARAEYQKALSEYQQAQRGDEKQASPALVAALKAARDTAQAAMDAARGALAAHYLRAPFDGMVGASQVRPGDLLRAGRAVTSLESIRNLEVGFRVPAHYLAELQPGMAVSLSGEASPGETFQGSLIPLDAGMDAGDSLAVKARFDNTEGRVRPGEPMRVRLRLSKHAALLVPAGAIVTRDAKNYVFTAIANAARLCPVVLGERGEGWVEIIQGLQPGDPVIVNGLEGLSDGEPVRRIEDSGALRLERRALGEELV
jgi:membrane fusion protein (multidrug efflux system)